MQKIVCHYLIIIILLCFCSLALSGTKKKLMDAIADGDIETVKRLVLSDPNLIKFRTKNGKTLLHYAATHNVPRIENFLLTADADTNMTRIEEFLLTAGADVNACDDWGNTSLIDAVINSCTHTTRVVASLLKAHPDCNARGYMGRTALYHACYNNDFVSVHLLLEAGAETKIPDRVDVTPLHIAAQNGCFDMTRLLLRWNAPQDAQDKKGRMPLHYAALYKRPDIAELLLEYDGRLVDALDTSGSTPLHYAAQFGELSLVRLLILRHGASFITNKLNHTPSDLAASYNSFVILNFFLCYGLPVPSQALKKLQKFYPDCKEVFAFNFKRIARPLLHYLHTNNLDVMIGQNTPVQESESQQSAQAEQQERQRLSELLLAFLFADSGIVKQIMRSLQASHLVLEAE